MELNYKVGDCVFWHDPANQTNGSYTVLGIQEPIDKDSIILIGNGVSEAEVTANELEHDKNIIIGILCYDTWEVDIVTTSEVEIAQYGGYENFLFDRLAYSPDNIHWIASEKLTVNYLTSNDYEL